MQKLSVPFCANVTPDDRLDVVLDEIRSMATPAFTCLTAIVTYAVVSPQGKHLHAMQNRLSWVIKMTAGVGAIVYEHTSVPVGFEGGKAVVQRASKPRAGEAPVA